MAAFLVAAMSTFTFAQKASKFSSIDSGSAKALMAPTPVVVPGANNTECFELIGQTGFEHMSDDFQKKFDSGQFGLGLNSTNLTVGVTNPDGVGLAATANLTISFFMSSSTTFDWWQLQWNSPSNLDRLVSAVIVKGGSQGKNVYTYPTLAASDFSGGFTTPGGTQGISHVSFCFEPFSAPSSAPAGLAGRVATSRGAAISGATVMVQNLNTGEVKYASTNSFGRYAFKGLPVGDFYALSVNHRRYIFDDATQYFTLESSLTDMDFTAR